MTIPDPFLPDCDLLAETGAEIGVYAELTDWYEAWLDWSEHVSGRPDWLAVERAQPREIQAAMANLMTKRGAYGDWTE